MTEKIDYIVQGCASRRVWLLCLALAFAVLFPVLDVIETYAQDLQLDLPEESGPVRVQPAKPVAAPSSQQPEKQPAVQAQPGAPVETPQAESKGRPLQDALRTMSTRLLNVVTADNGHNGAAIVGRAQLSGEYRDRRDGSVQFENVARVDVLLGERFLVRADLPFLWLDPQTSGSTSVTGFGDLSVRLGGGRCGELLASPSWPEAISFSLPPAAQSSVGENIRLVQESPRPSRFRNLTRLCSQAFNTSRRWEEIRVETT